MSALIGTWTLESGENLNEYLKQLGMSVTKRKQTLNLQPKIIITQEGDMWRIAIDMKNKGTDTLFTEGQTVDTSNELKYVFDSRFYFDSRRLTSSVFKFENPNKLVQTMKFTDTNEQQVIVREIDSDGNLLELLEMNGVKASRKFKRTA